MCRCCYLLLLVRCSKWVSPVIPASPIGFLTVSVLNHTNPLPPLFPTPPIDATDLVLETVIGGGFSGMMETHRLVLEARNGVGLILI